MKTNDIFIKVINNNGNKIQKSNVRKESQDYFLYSHVCGVKFEWWSNTNRIVLGYGNSSDDRNKIYEEIPVLIEEITTVKNKKLLASYTSFYLQDDISEIYLQNTLQRINDYLVENCDAWEKSVGSSIVEAKVGVNFSGTLFENLKERGTTMSPMFGSMVCDASGMKINRMLCEYYIPGGRIDGVEIDLEGNIVSIYECGSGIHKGDFLDWDHWNKVLCKYLYSEKVYTEYLKKVVILAGGYCDEMLLMSKNVSNLLVKSNIEFILLKTNREENNIVVKRI
jgi:hypothetical protein